MMTRFVCTDTALFFVLLPVCLSVCLSVCPSGPPSVCLSVCLCGPVSVYRYIFARFSVDVSVSLPVCVSVYDLLWASLHLSLFVHPFLDRKSHVIIRCQCRPYFSQLLLLTYFPFCQQPLSHSIYLSVHSFDLCTYTHLISVRTLI